MSTDKNCRLCLCSVETYANLFRGNLREMVKDLTSIEITEDDQFSNLACLNCVQEVQDAHRTRSRIIEAHQKLLEFGSQQFIIKDEPEALDDRLSEEDTQNVVEFEQVMLEPENKDASNTELAPTEPLSPKKRQQRTRKSKKEARSKISRSCTECNINFGHSLYSYNLHMMKHKKSACKICGIVIRTDNMSKHVEGHTGGPRVCDLCGVTCKNMESLRGHIFYMHRTSPSDHKCDVCERTFRTKNKLQWHVKKEHLGVRKFPCSQCNKSFFSVANLNSHVRTRHMQLRPHECTVCKRKFSSRHALKTHIRQHTNETPYKCYVCAEGFRQKVSLRTHLKSKHKIEEPKDFPCEFCEKAFSTEFALKVHLRLHSDDNYKCEICEDYFQLKIHLANHMNKEHKIKPEVNQETTPVIDA